MVKSKIKKKTQKQETSYELDKYESELREKLKSIMKEEDINLSLFLPVLFDKVPEKNSDEYYVTLKKAGIKTRRGSLSVEEVLNMLKLVGRKLEFTLEGKPITFLEEKIDKKIRLRFTDLMYAADLLNIQINWVKATDGTPKSKKKQK